MPHAQDQVALALVRKLYLRRRVSGGRTTNSGGSAQGHLYPYKRNGPNRVLG